MNRMLQRLQEKVAAYGLHQIVAARLQAEGYKVAADDTHAFLQALGQKIYEKSAEYRHIVDGLKAFEELK